MDTITFNLWNGRTVSIKIPELVWWHTSPVSTIRDMLKSKGYVDAVRGEKVPGRWTHGKRINPVTVNTRTGLLTLGIDSTLQSAL